MKTITPDEDALYFHNLLKQLGRKYLKEKFGFTDEQIFEEFKMGDYVIDLVGMSDKLKVALECGNCGRKRYDELKKYFDYVKIIRRGRRIFEKKEKDGTKIYRKNRKERMLRARLEKSELKLLDDICSMIGRNRSETIRDLIIAFHVLAKSGIWQQMPTVPELAEKILKE
jgi:hypothetical protein